MLSCLLAFTLLLHLSHSLLEDAFVTFNQTTGAVPIHGATVIHSYDESPGVRIAVASLLDDFEAITGNRPPSWQYRSNDSSTPQGHAIVVSTLDSELMRQVRDRTNVDLSMLEGKREAFLTMLISDALPGLETALLIAGSDSRAATFGVHTLAEQAGQSPFHYWLDVPPKEHDEIYALPTTTYSGEPAVKYRGLFINDEAPATTGWWSRTHGVDHYPLDSEYYRHVFDLLLRLKANFIWPAMWASTVPEPGNIFFTDDPYNQQMADDYGIVVSTSHHEPMQRATNEWNETETGPWDWTVNADNVTKFMREGVERAKGMDTYFTLGMRGPNDAPIKGDDPISILRDVFEVEQDMLSDILGSDTEIKKVWTIYKEVAQYYAGGLIPEEDVTLMFTDDNWGNPMHLPLANETARRGGVGLYFHLEYVGVPHSYKWYNSNNFAKILKDLYQAHQRGVSQIWVINVADIKPMELPFGLIMDYAWDPSRITFETIIAYLEHFCAREFGLEYAEEIASILFEQSRLVARRKLESTISSTYSVLNYNESQRVLGEWDRLAMRTMAVDDALPQELKAAFFHLAMYPNLAGWNYHRTVLGQGQNYQYGQERRNQANSLAYDVIDYFEQDYDYEQTFNELEGGKWNGLMAQPHFRPNTTYMDWMTTSRDVLMNLTFVQLRQNPDYEWGPVGIYAEGNSSAASQGFSVPSIDISQPTGDRWAPGLPTFTRYGAESHFVEIFHRGDHRVSHNWNITNDHDWLRISQTSGQISREQPSQRIDFSIDWSSVPADYNENVTVTATWDASPYFDYIHIPVFGAEVPDDFHGFPEDNGILSIEAAHFQRKSPSDSVSTLNNSNNVSFTTIPHLGSRTDSGALALRPYTAARSSSLDPASIWVDYDIYLTARSSPLGANATVYLTTNLDTDPTLLMQYSLTVDGQAGNWTRVLETPEIPGDLPPTWMAEVENNVWTREVKLGQLETGKHTLRWMANSPEVYLEKIVVVTRGELPESYLGPPEGMML